MHETYAALSATHQSVRASDGRVRRALRTIASDETRHAALSFAVARWVERRLTRAAAKRVRAAQLEAIAQLARELAADVPLPLCEVAGLPDPNTALRLHRNLQQHLWSRA